MAEFTFPGVYIEEVPTNARPIEGVETSTTAMVGITERGPLRPEIIKSFRSLPEGACLAPLCPWV